MEETHRIRERVFNEHPLGVPRDQLLGGQVELVGEQNCGFVVAKILDE